jgi:hypothetical protein
MIWTKIKLKVRDGEITLTQERFLELLSLGNLLFNSGEPTLPYPKIINDWWTAIPVPTWEDPQVTWKKVNQNDVVLITMTALEPVIGPTIYTDPGNINDQDGTITVALTSDD